jgi:hypothetical protein
MAIEGLTKEGFVTTSLDSQHESVSLGSDFYYNNLVNP